MPTRPAPKPPVKRKPAARPKAPAAEKPSRKESRRTRHAGRLQAALLSLRGTLKEVQEHYSVRTNGLLVQMLQIVDPSEGGKDRPALPSRKTIDQMLEMIAALKVKPKKGRGKDLLRLQDLMEALWIQFPPQP